MIEDVIVNDGGQTALNDCVTEHFVNCPATSSRALVKDKDFTVLNVRGVNNEFKED